MRILLIEDDITLAEIISQSLKREYFSVDIIHDGEDGYYQASGDIYDIIILDIMLPRMDGITVLKKLREDEVQTPILVLTARGEINHRVEGLNKGADDYLPKPFATEELIARIKALTRRKDRDIIDNRIQIDDLILNTSNLTLSCHSRQVTLTAKEFNLLHYLIMRKGNTTTKEQIIDKLWGYESNTESNNVEVYISLLRKKIKFLGSSLSITTIRKIGYLLEG